MAKEKEEEDRRKNPQKYEKKEATPMFKNDGEIRQCNEGSGILIKLVIWS